MWAAGIVPLAYLVAGRCEETLTMLDRQTPGDY
jgi:hypothetical protein